MQRSLSKRLGYSALHLVLRLFGVVLFGLRCKGRNHMPDSGPVLVCANHQSFLDPVLIGATLDRRLNYLARESLFRFAPFRWLIQFLDAIPIDRDGMGIAGLKESLRRIRRGEMVLIFPEGTRTETGDVGPLEPGFCVLARRCRAALVPVGIDGAFEAWPRNASRPKLSRIHVCVGKAIQPETVAGIDDEQLVHEVEKRIRECHETARWGRLR